MESHHHDECDIQIHLLPGNTKKEYNNTLAQKSNCRERIISKIFHFKYQADIKQLISDIIKTINK